MKSCGSPPTVSVEEAAVSRQPRTVLPCRFLVSTCLCCLFLVFCISSTPVATATESTDRAPPHQTRLPFHLALQKPHTHLLSTLLNRRKNMVSGARYRMRFSSRLLSPPSLPTSYACLFFPLFPQSASSLLDASSLPPISLPFFSALSTLLSSVRTLLLHGLLRVVRLPSSGVFASDIWQMPYLGFSALSSLRRAPDCGTANYRSRTLLWLPHTLPAASAAVPSPAPAPETHRGPTHRRRYSNPLNEGFPLASEEDEGAGELGENKRNPAFFSDKPGLPDELLQRFYSRFPDPSPPPSGLIELDAATWDLIADVVSSPGQPGKGQTDQPSARAQGSYNTHAEPQREQQQHKQRQREEEQQQQQTQEPSLGAASTVLTELEHSTASPTPPRLWLVALMASGCVHCRRLRPVLQQLQRRYSTKVRRLRAARRRALVRSQQEATAALSAAAAARAAAYRDLLRLSVGQVREEVVKVAEQHAVMMQQDEQSLQQKLLLQVSQLYSAAATAAWAYPDVVFATFDCMQNQEHQRLCEEIFGVSTFPTVLLLRSLPSLASLTARAAEQPPLPASLLCPSARSRKHKLSSDSAAAPAAPDGFANTGADGVSAYAPRLNEEKEELSFLSSPLLRERRGQQRRHAQAAAAARLRKERMGSKALLCALQEELLADFPPLAIPSLQQLQMFLYRSAAEAASWAPVVPPPAAFLQLLLLSATVSSSAVAPTSAAAPATAGSAAAAAENAAAAKKEAADAAAVAVTFLQKEERHRNSNSFRTWLATRMRGEAVREVVSPEEIHLLHYDRAAATAATRCGSCGSPTVSFLLCLDLARVLHTERGEDAQSFLVLPQQYVPQQNSEHQQRQQQHQQHQQRPKQERSRRSGTVVGGEAVRLNGLRAAFETFAAAAGEQRLEHLFLYSLDPAACSPAALQSHGLRVAAAQQLHVKMQQHLTAATAGTGPGTGPGAAAGGTLDGSNSSDLEQQQEQYPLRVVALQPTLLVQGWDGDIGGNEYAREKDEEADAPEAAAWGSSHGRQEAEETADNEMTGYTEQRKVLLLQYILERIWAVQRIVTLKLQQREGVETDAKEGRRSPAAGLLHEGQETRGRERCRGEGGGDQPQGRCVEPRGEEEQQRRLEQLFETSVLEENERLNAMQLPTFVGPFPPHLDQLKASSLTRGAPAVAAASVYAAVSSPPLASFIDVFRLPTLSLVGSKNFIDLRISCSSSWIPAASSSSSGGAFTVGRRQLVVAVLDLRILDMLLAFKEKQVAAAIEEALEQQRQVAVLTHPLSTAAATGAAGSTDGGDLHSAKEENSAGETLPSHTAGNITQTSTHDGVNSSATRSADANHSSNNSVDNKHDSGKNTGGSSSRESRGGRWGGASLSWLRSFLSWAASGGKSTGGLDVPRQHAAASSGSSVSMHPNSRSAFSAVTRVDRVTLALSATPLSSDSVSADAAATAAAADAAVSSPGSGAATAAASGLIKLVEQLWQLSWAARQALLHSRVDLLQPLLNSDHRDGRDNRRSSSRSSPLPVFTSPFVFGMLDGFSYSEALADYDVHVNEEGELPAVLAFDPALPPADARSSSNSCSSGSSSSRLASGMTTETESRRTAERSTAYGTSWSGSDESCRSDGSSCSVDVTAGEGNRGCDTATGAVEGKGRKGPAFVAYYYRDRLRLRLEELPRGLSLLRMQALEGRRESEEEEEEEEDERGGSTISVLPRQIIRAFVYIGRRMANWLRKEYKAASHSRIALIRLSLSLLAFILILACTAVLLIYSVFCPSGDSTEGEEEEEAESEAETADTTELDTEEEEEVDEEREEAEERGKDAQGTENREGTRACTVDDNEQQKTTEGSRGNSDSTGSSSNGNDSPTSRAEKPKMPSIEEVRQRAEKMLRRRR